MTRSARRIIVALVFASMSSCVVRPPRALIPSTPTIGDLDVEPGQRLVGDRADQLVGLGARHAAGHDELQPRPQRQLGGDVQRVGDHGQVEPLGEQPGHRVRGGAAGQPDGERAVRQPGGGEPGDRALLLAVLADAVAHRQLVARRRRRSRRRASATSSFWSSSTCRSRRIVATRDARTRRRARPASTEPWPAMRSRIADTRSARRNVLRACGWLLRLVERRRHKRAVKIVRLRANAKKFVRCLARRARPRRESAPWL